MTITLGFDLLAEADRDIASALTSAFFFTGRLPGHFQALPAWQNTPFASMEVFFQGPAVRLEAAPTGVMAVFSQQLTIRNDHIPGEIVNTLEIHLPLTLHERTLAGATVQVLEIDMAQVNFQNIRFVNTVNVVLETLINVAVIAALQAHPVAIPVTPPMLPAIRFFPVVGESPADLKLYATIDGRDGGPTSAKPAMLRLPKKFDSLARANLAVGIEANLLLNQIRTQLVALGVVNDRVLIDNMDKTLIDLKVGGSVTIDPSSSIPFFPEGGITIPLSIDFSPKLKHIRLTSDLGVELIDGAVRVTGSLFASIDNAPDVDASFDVKIGFFVRPDKLIPVILNADIDVDTGIIQTMMAVLFGPLGLVLANAIDSAIDTAVSNAAIGKSVAVDIPKKTVFLGDVAVTDGASADHPIVVRLVPARLVCHADALEVGFNVAVDYQRVFIPLPPYFIANTQSKEFHAETCIYGLSVSPKKREIFVRPSEAIAAGYDGCRRCQPQHDGKGAGMLMIRYQRAAGFNAQRTAPIQITGTLAQPHPAGKFGADFNETGSVGLSNADGYWHDEVFMPTLAAGIWTITVTDGEWSVKKIIQVHGGKHKDKNVDFEYGKDSPAPGPQVGGLKLKLRAPGNKIFTGKSNPSFSGVWQGAADDSPSAQPWNVLGGDPVPDGAGMLASTRTAPFLKPGVWMISADGQPAVEVVVEANKLRDLLFELPG